MKTIEVTESGYFESFNNAFGLNPEDHKKESTSKPDSEIDYSFNSSDDLMKAFSNISLLRLSSLNSDDYERDCYLMPYMYTNQPPVHMGRSRSASAPIPIAKLNAAKCLFSRHEKKRAMTNADCTQVALEPGQKLNSLCPLNVNPSDTNDEQVITDNDDDIPDISLWVPRNRSRTIPFADTLLDDDLALNDVIQNGSALFNSEQDKNSSQWEWQKPSLLYT